MCRDTPDDQWSQIRFMVFDGEAEGPFDETVEQIEIESADHLQAVYDSITDSGGEGVIVTNGRGASSGPG